MSDVRPIPSRSSGEGRLEFEIAVDGGAALLLRPSTFFGWLRVDHLELEIPNVSFPLDITRGIRQFKTRRCRLAGARLVVEQPSRAALVAARSGALARAGFDEVQLRLLDGKVELSARARVGSTSADLVVSASIQHADHELILLLDEARLFGHLRRAAPLLAHDLLCLLLAAPQAMSRSPYSPGSPPAPGPADGEEDGGATSVDGLRRGTVRPLDLVLARLFPPAGWRLPDASATRLSHARIEQGRAEFHFAPAPQPLVAPPLRSPGGAALPDLATSGEAALLRGDLDGSIAAHRAAMLTEPGDERRLTERLLLLLVARDGMQREAERVAREALRRWPDFVPAHLALGAVALERGQWAEAADQYARVVELADAQGADETAVRAALAAARLVRSADPARAIPLYERVHWHRPGCWEATEALSEWLRGQERWCDFLAVWQRWIDSAVGLATTVARVRLRRGEVMVERLGDAASARLELEEAVRLDDQLERAWDLLATALELLSDRPAAMAALERMSELRAAAADPRGEAAVQARLALLAEASSDGAEAARRMDRAQQLCPDDAELVAMASGLAARSGQLAQATAGYERILATCADGSLRSRAQQALLELRIATGDLAGARECLQRLVAPPPVPTLVRLAALEGDAGHLEAAAALLERAAELAGPPEAAELELKRAHLLESTGRRAEMVAALERAHQLDPGSATGERAARELLGLCRARNDAVAEGRWIDALLAGEPLPVDGAALLLRRAELQLAAGDAATARRFLDRAQAAGGDPTTIRRLHADALEALGDHLGRADLLESIADGAAATDRADLLAAAVGARLSGGDPVGALELARRAAAVAGAHEGVRRALGEALFRNHLWEEVVAFYGALLPEASAQERAFCARRLAAGLDHAGRSHDALAVLAAAVDAHEARGEELVALWRQIAALHQRLGNFGEAAEALVAAARDPGTEEPATARAGLYSAAAGLLHRRLGDRGGALLALEAALHLDPACVIALDGIAAIHAEAGDHAALAAALWRQVEAVAAPERRLELLARVAEVEQRAPDEARRAYRMMLEIDPAHRAALRFLAADTRARGDHAAAAGYYLRLSEAPTGDAAADPAMVEERTAALANLAELARHDGRFADAERHLTEAVSLAAPPQREAMLAALATIYSEQGRWTDLASLLARCAEASDDPAAATAWRERAVRILLDGVGNTEAALEVARTAATSAPEDPRALALFAEAALAADRPDERAAALVAVAARCEEPLERAVALAEAAQLERHRLGRPDRADALEQQLLAGAGSAAERLALAGRVRSPALARRLAEQAADRALGEEERIAALRLAHRMASSAGEAQSEATLLAALRAAGAATIDERGRLAALATEDGRHALAAELFGEALRMHLASLGAARQPLDDAGRMLLAALRSAARACDHFRPLADGLEAVVEAELDPGALAGWLEELARVKRDHLGDPVGAEAAATRVRALRPVDPLPLVVDRPEGIEAAYLTALVDQDGASGQLAGAAELEQALARLPASEVTQISALRLQLGTLQLRAGNAAAAAHHLELVVAEEPTCEPALDRLAELYVAEGRWERAVETLDRLAALAPSQEREAQLLTRIGEIHADRLAAPERAVDAFLKAIDLDARHVPTVRRLVDHYWSVGDDESLLDIAGEFADLSEQPEAIRARVAVAAALSGDGARAEQAALSLGSGAAAAMAEALLQAIARPGAPLEAVAAAARMLCRPPGPPLDEVRAVLLARGPDARATAIVVELEREGA
jgi:tetratricopeptide (TPR) repeat protein